MGRRLPNTDQARIKAMETAISKSGTRVDNKLVMSFKSTGEASSFVTKFKRERQLYMQSYDQQVKSSKKYQVQVRNVRLYISHFIQVLNMCVLRNEIKKDAKKLYNLEPMDFSVPDLTTETSILKWGENIIKGENQRIADRGVPIYNPTIAKVNVHYNIFTEAYYNQKVLQNNTTRNLEKVAVMREEADRIILDIWNQIEECFKDYPNEKRLQICQEYGVVYYYRTKEKRNMEAAQMQKALAFDENE